jgi:hypothetical protein
MSRFFAVTASTSAFRRSTWATDRATLVGCRPPAPLGLGEPNRTLRCLTSSVARRCYRESSILSRSTQAFGVLRREALGYPPCQSQMRSCLVRATRTLGSGRLQPA